MLGADRGACLRWATAFYDRVGTPRVLLPRGEEAPPPAPCVRVRAVRVGEGVCDAVVLAGEVHAGQ